MNSAGSRSDWISGIAGVATGLGVLAFALFPLAVPIVILTIVAVLPLALPLVALAAVAAVLAGTWLAVRAAGRGVRRLGRGPRSPAVTRARTGSAPAAQPHARLGDAATGPRPC